MEQKKDIRVRVKQSLANIQREDLSKRSGEICDKAWQLISKREVKKIMLYMAIRYEVDLASLIDKCIIAGIKLYFPRINGDDIEAVEYDDNFAVGAYGILEPRGAASDIELDMIIVPIAAVSANGDRLGKGKGYYDRYLAKHANSYRLALAFEEQLVEKLPTEPHDVAMNKVILG